ncbi:response regulator [Taibaiella koreensis]|uniref:response regulator n=1 Tax=Taibaiella koreensis TaxID=1268548 RepID=UPI000E59CB9D|nr:response regulator transcription factor [Taibaiella koreensis]
MQIAIADDHPMVIKGIQNMLRDYPHISIGQVYENGKQLMDGLKQQQPDVLLLDIHMPYANGNTLMPQIIGLYPALSVLVLTNVEQPYQVKQMMEQGALGYLLKSTDQETLVAALTKVYAGKQYIDALLKAPLQAHIIAERKKALTLPSLSRREKEVLQLIVAGSTNQEIAATLFLGQRTVETYRLNLMAKLAVKNTASLVRKAIEDQLLG